MISWPGFCLRFCLRRQLRAWAERSQTPHELESPDFSAGMRSDLASGDIRELVMGRASPGVIILDLDNRLLYANREALHLLPDSPSVPEEICRLCDRVKQSAAGGAANASPGSECELFWIPGDVPYSLRAFLIGSRPDDQTPTHMMVLVEKVAEHRDINLKRAKSRFGLSSREIEVVVLVARGLSNKEIGARLFVSEYTVKDHLKNIMRKLAATSRSEIIAILK